jgi:P27 family predicted phage terminase small subunit
MKGRKPKLHVVADREGARSARRPAPPLVAGDFDPPQPLGEIGLAEWKRIRAEAPWISAASAGALWLRCATFEDMIAARADIKKRGRLIRTRNGSVKNPSLQVAREAASLIVRIDIEMGLTSISEQKVHAPAGPAVDELEDRIG